MFRNKQKVIYTSLKILYIWCITISFVTRDRDQIWHFVRSGEKFNMINDLMDIKPSNIYK